MSVSGAATSLCLRKRLVIRRVRFERGWHVDNPSAVIVGVLILETVGLAAVDDAVEVVQ